jgi:replication initiator protein A
MSKKTTSPSKKTSLRPVLHPQNDLFICDVSSAVLKDDMASMEHPFFSLSKKPEMSVRRYENGKSWLEVVPSVKGLATIYDKDILIYCISQLMAKIKNGQTPTPHLKIVVKELLIFINRSIGGKDYEYLIDAIERLDGTRIRTNIKTGDKETLEMFGLIDHVRIRRSEKTNRILELSITLSDWVFRSVIHKEVLTLHRDYFRLRKSTERRLYEIARKHCGKQDSWKVRLDLLKIKCGSRGAIKHFRQDIKAIMSSNHLPDYKVSIDEDDFVTFIYRSEEKPFLSFSLSNFPVLEDETMHDARVVAPGYDIQYLLYEWKSWWCESGRPVLHNPDAAFIGFCKMHYRRNRNP